MIQRKETNEMKIEISGSFSNLKNEEKMDWNTKKVNLEEQSRHDKDKKMIKRRNENKEDIKKIKKKIMKKMRKRKIKCQQEDAGGGRGCKQHDNK